MALPLPQGTLFHIEHRILPANFEMPFLEVSSDHYSLVYHIKGDRTVITPNCIFSLHPGDVSSLAPFVYHRSIPASSEVYESFLLKFTPQFVKPLTDHFGEQLLDRLYVHPTNSFSAEIQDEIHRLFESLLKHYHSDSLYRECMLQCILSELLLTIIEHRQNSDHANVHNTPLTPPIMDSIYYLEKHYSESFSIDDIAAISRKSFSFFPSKNRDDTYAI